MTLRSRRLLLLLLPLLLTTLIVSLAAAKPRATKPSLSKIDRALRAQVPQAPWLFVTGEGRIWRRLTGLEDWTGFMLKDRATYHEMRTILHCSNRFLPGPDPAGDGSLTVIIPVAGFRSDRPQWHEFTYWHGVKGIQVSLGSNMTLASLHGTMQPLAAPRFETLVRHLLRRAKRRHSNVVIEPFPWIGT